MAKNDEKINPSTSYLMENLVDGVVDNELDVNDPIIKYLVKNEGWNDGEESECDSRGLASDDSDIEVLIEEHILLEKLKQVTGKRREECIGSENNCESEDDDENQTKSALGNSNASDLILLKTQIEEAMQLNLKMREELLTMEKKLVHKYREACERKQEKLKELMADPKLKLLGPSDRFLDSFRAPYFKCQGSVAPLNADSVKIMHTNIPLISLNCDWNTATIASLCIAVRKYLLCERSELNRGGKRNKARDSALPTNTDIGLLKHTPLYDLVKDRNDDSFDWKGIASYVSKSLTERDCSQMWSLHVKPSLKDWTSEEHSKMLVIAKAYKLQNWDKIAAELNSGRSGYECFSYHQTSVNLDWNDGRWSKEEEEHLSKVIENSKIGNFISWDKITYLLDTKFVEQIYAKWHGFKAPHITRGPFTEREDRVLLGMIHKFGADLKTVAAVLKNRSVAQLTARYKDHLLPQLRLKIGEWTVEEDEKLLDLVKEHGEANWATIAKCFETRSRVQIRHRHKLLKNKLANNPNLNLNMLSRPKRPTSKKRVSKNRSFYSKVISGSSKNIKSLLRAEEIKQTKRMKPIDMKLTQYYQMKFINEKVNESQFLNRYREKNKKSSVCPIDLTKDEVVEEDYSPFKVNAGKSLLSSLIFSSIALRNLQEAADTDKWSQKDRSSFNKGILELSTTSEETKKDLFNWHKVFCSVFAAPTLLSHVNLDNWENILSKEKEKNG